MVIFLDACASEVICCVRLIASLSQIIPFLFLESVILPSIHVVPSSIEKTSSVELPSEKVAVSSTNVQPSPASKSKTLYSIQSLKSTTQGNCQPIIARKIKTGLFRYRGLA